MLSAGAEGQPRVERKGPVMAKILVGIDGSQGSRAALRWAAGLGAALGLGLRALWAWQYPADTVVQLGRAVLPDAQQMDQLVKERLGKLVAEEVGAEGGSVVLQVARGPAAPALLKAALDGVALVVVGSRGRGGFKGLLLGSVSRQVCEFAPCPVVVLRDGRHAYSSGLATILVGVDGSAGAARAVDWVTSVADTAGAQVVVAHALPSRAKQGPEPGAPGQHDLVQQWAQPLRDRGVPYRVALAEGDPRVALLEVADREDADLVVVGSRGRGPVTALVLGSVAASLAQHGQRPTAIVH